MKYEKNEICEFFLYKRAYKKIDYKELNTHRKKYREEAKCFPIFKILDNIVFKSISNEHAIFSDLYNLLQNEDLLYEAFARIKNNKGAFTIGTKNINIDKKPSIT